MNDMLDALEVWLQARLEDVHTMLPGIVQSYDATARTATVKPRIRLRSLHGDLLEIPPIPSVPVAWPSTSQMSLFGDLVPGDGVILLFCESSMGNWQRGSQEVDAEDESRFSLQDCVAIPGLWPKDLVPKHNLRSARWGMASTKLAIGGTGDGKAVVENATTDLRAEINKIWEAVDALAGHLKTWAPVASSLGAPVVPDPVAVAQITADQAGWDTDKAALGGLLK